MAVRMVINHRDDLKSMVGVESRGLERERHEKNLAATSPASLLLCCRKESRPEPLFPPRLFYPELPDLQATAPCVPADPGNNSTCLVSHEDRQPPAVSDACRRRVELVDSVLQILDLFWCGIRIDDEFGTRHRDTP